MRTIQEIFDIVINAGYYRKYKDVENGDRYDTILSEEKLSGISYFMCDCLYYAYDDEVITEVERDYAISEIECYMSTGITQYCLRRCLDHAGLPFKFSDRVALYSDWENRPDLSAYLLKM